MFKLESQKRCSEDNHIQAIIRDRPIQYLNYSWKD